MVNKDFQFITLYTCKLISIVTILTIITICLNELPVIFRQFLCLSVLSFYLSFSIFYFLCGSLQYHSTSFGTRVFFPRLLYRRLVTPISYSLRTRSSIHDRNVCSSHSCTCILLYTLRSKYNVKVVNSCQKSSWTFISME